MSLWYIEAQELGWILTHDLFNCIFLKQNLFLNTKLLRFVPYGPTDNMSELIQVLVVRCRHPNNEEQDQGHHMASVDPQCVDIAHSTRNYLPNFERNWLPYTPVRKTFIWEYRFYTIYNAVPLYHGQFCHKYSQETSHSSPVRASYGVFFVDPASDWYSATVPVIVYVITCNIGSRYNGFQVNWCL